VPTSDAKSALPASGEPGQYRLLVVDDDPAVVTVCAKALRLDGHVVDTAQDGAQALKLLATSSYAVLIADQRMPGIDGVALCERAHQRWPATLCVLITACPKLEVMISAINRAQAFRALAKPFTLGELRTAVAQACAQYRMAEESRSLAQHVERRTVELRETNRKLDREVHVRTGALLLGLVNALDLRDTETHGHSRRVALYARLLGEQLGLAGKELVEVERGALLHDIGKIGVSDRILRKPGKLGDDEWAEMRKHAQYGFEMLQGIDFLERARVVVRSHHERFDGKGYPDGMLGPDIALGARIFAVIDTYDAMTSDRPYRKALATPVARTEIHQCRGSQLDPHCVEAFLDIAQQSLDEVRAQVALSPRATFE